MYQILVCDDDHDIVSALEIYLTGEGYGVTGAYSGQEAIDLFQQNQFHLVLMDIMMPGMDGIAATAELRKLSNVPIIFLTAKSEDTDKILGLNMGADDYITKPFNPLEVIARVRSHLRRYTQLGGQISAPHLFTVGSIVLDDGAKTVTVDGEPVSLTPLEFQILRLHFLGHLCQSLTQRLPTVPPLWNQHHQRRRCGFLRGGGILPGRLGSIRSVPAQKKPDLSGQAAL